jgi:hypothetical protein
MMSHASKQQRQSSSHGGLVFHLELQALCAFPSGVSELTLWCTTAVF